MEVRQRDAAVDGVPPVRQLVVGVEAVEVVLAILELEGHEHRHSDTLTAGEEEEGVTESPI